MRIPDSYKNLFNKFSQEEGEYLIDLFRGKDRVDYPFGYFLGKLSERNHEVLELIDDLNQKRFHEEGFKAFIVSLEQANNLKEAQSLFEKIKGYDQDGKIDYISIKKLEFNLAYLKELDFKKIVKYYKSIFDSLCNESNIFNCEADEYVALKALELMYQYHCQSTKRFLVTENNNLEKLYLSKGIALSETDPQYSKHKLLTINDNFTLSDSNIPKVYDDRLKEYIRINEISPELLAFFKKLMEQGFIGSIALRPEYSLVGGVILDLSIALEELERGEIFSFEKLGVASVTKLYSKHYDTLWITIDSKNITFEEILQDFDVHGDSIVTQVVHLEYAKLSDEEQVIVHIDHEYIFYTEDEFCLRQANPKQKGNARKRYKTFKIDNSKIPFIVNNMFVIYYVLGKYFKEKALLEEYFSEVLKT